MSETVSFQLCKALGLDPADTSGITIEVEPTVIYVTVRHKPIWKKEQATALVERLSKYKLVPRESEIDDTSLADKAVHFARTAQ